MDATWSKTTAALGGRGQILLAASAVLLVLTAATPVPAGFSHVVLGVYQSYTQNSGSVLSPVPSLPSFGSEALSQNLRGVDGAFASDPASGSRQNLPLISLVTFEAGSPLQAIGDAQVGYPLGTDSNASQSDLDVRFSDEAPGSFGGAVFTDY